MCKRGRLSVTWASRPCLQILNMGETPMLRHKSPILVTKRYLLLCLLFFAAQTRPAGIDSALWQQLQQINAKTTSIHDLTADFTQQKFTAMLAQPLVSHGNLDILGSVMLWNTTDPENTQMHIDAHQIQIYYLSQKTLEVYDIAQKLASLAASPLPKLSILEKYFTFAALPADKNSPNTLSVQLNPIGDLTKHVQNVRVLLDVNTGLLLRMELTDTDQDRTVISFSNIHTNIGLHPDDVTMKLPRNVKVTHPLAGLDSESEQP